MVLAPARKFSSRLSQWRQAISTPGRFRLVGRTREHGRRNRDQRRVLAASRPLDILTRIRHVARRFLSWWRAFTSLDSAVVLNTARKYGTRLSSWRRRSASQKILMVDRESKGPTGQGQAWWRTFIKTVQSLLLAFRQWLTVRINDMSRILPAGFKTRILVWKKGLPGWPKAGAEGRISSVLVKWLAIISRLSTKVVPWWSGLSRVIRFSLVGGAIFVAIAVTLGLFSWSGLSATLEARETYQDLQAELSHLTPVDLVQVDVYQSLEGRFREAEEASARARSRLGFLRAFQWLPVVGSRIKEANVLLDMGYYQGRAGGNLAGAYRAAIAIPLDEMAPDVAADEVTRVLSEASPQLSLVLKDLRRVRELRGQLGATERGVRFGLLVDRYIPALQTVAFLSKNQPGVIGHTYGLSRELSSLQELAADPLEVFANTEEVSRALTNITEQAIALESEFKLVRLTIQANIEDDTDELRDVMKFLETMGPGITLLRHVTAGTNSLVAMAKAMESSGFLSSEFGSVAGPALEEAQLELKLAKEEASSLQALISLQGIDVESFLPSIVFSGNSGVSISTTDRVEVLLDEAINATKFLSSFLGFDGPKTYLLIGQNQKEIRATGGFIGVVVQSTIDQGRLSKLVYLDSFDVDKDPLTDNPNPPEGLFWYLWMGRLLFRDANWSPHFPTSAAKVAEIYQLGQGVKIDGVIAGSKALMLDLVGLFGDITVPAFPDVLTRETAEGLTDGLIGYNCLPRHDATRGKRCFDEDVFFGLQERLTTTGVPDPLRRQLVELVKERLDQKNILIHVFPPTDDSFLWERGWNGTLPSVDHDYLMVVDSSLPGHSTEGLQRSFDYRVSLNTKLPIEAHLRIRYDNTDEPEDEICRQFAWEVYHCY